MKRQTKLIIGLAIAIISLCFSILRITDVIPTSPKRAKYVFYFIGDGMSFNHILGTEHYNTTKAGASETLRLNFTQFETRNFVTNYSTSNLVTDSAAAGTALASGVKTANAHIGVDVVDHRILCLGAARKAEIDVIHIKGARQKVLIAGAGTRCASALRDRRAVKDRGQGVGVIAR